MSNSAEVVGDALMEMVHVVAGTLTTTSAFRLYDRIADECRTAARTVEEIYQDELRGHGATYTRRRPQQVQTRLAVQRRPRLRETGPVPSRSLLAWRA